MVKILIVEDSLTQAERLKYILEKNNYSTEIANNGEAALELLEISKPDLIISDIIMPKMDGYQLCKRIKEDDGFRSIPIVLLTSLTDPTDVIKALMCKADSFITKPYKSEFLLYRLESMLANKRGKDREKAEGIEVHFSGDRYVINSEKAQMLDLLLSTFENAVKKNEELELLNRELTKAFDTIQKLESNHRIILQSNADALIVLNRNKTVRYVNPACEKMLGKNSGLLLGNIINIPLTTNEMKEITIVQPEGKEVIAEIRSVEINWEGENSYLASLRDVTEKVHMRETLKQQSVTDVLTGLYNRRGFIHMIEHHMNLSIRSKTDMLLFFIDLDGMKYINDNLGHNEGDLALVGTAKILREVFRNTDIIARIGGDEFAVLIIDASNEHSEIIKERIVVLQNHYNENEENRHHLSMSIGISKFDPFKPCTVDELMTMADERMYEEKRRKKPSRL